MKTFKVPFTVSLIGIAEVEAKSYEEAAAWVESQLLTNDGLKPWAMGMNVETVDEDAAEEIVKREEGGNVQR